MENAKQLLSAASFTQDSTVHDPLVHLIKNAISHGVEETSEDRVKNGKSERARVELCAYSKRGKIFIQVKDGRARN